MYKNTEKQLKELQNTRMTESESISIRKNLITFMEKVSPSHKYVQSPYMSFWSPVLVTAASIVFIIFGGSAIAYHASSSLPGDSLFAWKVNVNERVAGILTKSKSEKLKNEQFFIKNRIDELATLAENNELTEEKASIAEKNIDTHIANIKESAKDLAETNPKEFIEVAKGLDPIVDAHKKDAEEIANTKNEDTAETTLEKTTISTDISKNTAPKDDIKTATDSATKKEDKIVDNIISKVEKESGTLKEMAQSIIVDKKEVKDSAVKIDAQKEITPTQTIQ